MKMERQWRLGEDLSTYDDILDGLTFDDVILAVQCNIKNPTRSNVKNEMKQMLESRLEDMWYLFDNNIDLIIAEAMKGRGNYDME